MPRDDRKSPFCPSCMREGILSHTYKLAGQPYFKCHKDKRLYHRSEFEEPEFKWGVDVKSWRKKTGWRGKVRSGERHQVRRVPKTPKPKGRKAVR